MRSKNWQRNDDSGAGRGRRTATRRRSLKGRWWWLAAVAIAVVGSALIPATASAGPARYVFEMCDSSLPGGGVTGVRYGQNPGQPWEGVDNCEEPGGSLAIHLLGSIGPGGYATWALPIEPPPGGTMESTSRFPPRLPNARHLWLHPQPGLATIPILLRGKPHPFASRRTFRAL